LANPDDPVINDLVPEGYKFPGASRPASKGNKGGGVGFVLRDDIKIVTIPQPTYRTFELYIVRLEGAIPVTIALVYRPPPSPKNGLTSSDFFLEIEAFLSQLCTSVPGELCVIGDFNVHYDKPDSSHGKQLHDLLSELNLVQHVNTATHQKGHILDLVITRKDSHHKLVHSAEVNDIQLSDHFAVQCHLQTEHMHLPKSTRKVRSFKNVP
jgi:hypothetical protein